MFDSEIHDENDNIVDDSEKFFAPHALERFIVNETTYPHPFDAPAWPEFKLKDTVRKNGQINIGRQIKSAKKFLHTSEIHIFFEYTGTEAFGFSGDDDL